MKRLARILRNAATGVSLVLCAASLWAAAPDGATTRRHVLAATDEVFNEQMSRDLVSVRPVAGRLGHYEVEDPSPTYGELFVALPAGPGRR